jgi:hypothetical protein
MQAGALRMNGAGSAFERPIRIEYRPSFRLLLLLVVAHLGAGAALPMSGIPDWAKFAAAVLVVASLALRARAWLRELSTPAPPVLLLNARDEWQLLRANGTERMTVGADCVALPCVIILHLRDASRANRFFVLCADNVAPEILRRLRVRLRFPLSAPD